MPGPYNTDATADVVVRDLASQITGKVVLTTGVSPGGLGAFFVQQIAAATPALLILAGRNPSKTKATADALAMANPQVKTRMLQLDLDSLKKVRKAAAEVNSWANAPAIDVLVNNAAIMACDYARTEDGIEQQFDVGHIGPFLFTSLIMKKIMAAKAPRLVNVSSDGHRLSAIRWPDIGFPVSRGFPILFIARVQKREEAGRHGALRKEKRQLFEILDVAYNVDGRMASCTINGMPMARPKQQTCSSLPHWPRSWAQKA